MLTKQEAGFKWASGRTSARSGGAGPFADGTPAAVPVGPPNFTPPGGEVDVPPLAKGTHKFQCLIHPWMQTTVKVK